MIEYLVLRYQGQRRAAAAVGCSQTLLSLVLSGQRIITPELREKITDAYASAGGE